MPLPRCGVLLLAENNDDLLARRIVAASVMAISLPDHRHSFSARWAAESGWGSILIGCWSSSSAGRACGSCCDTRDRPLREWHDHALEERVRLGEAFVDRSLTTDYHALDEVDAQTLAAREAMHAKRYPSMRRRWRIRAKRRNAGYARGFCALEMSRSTTT